MTSLADFLLRQIADDEAAARAVPPLDHNFDMGGNRQDERWIFDRTLPSSADGMGNWSKHRHDPSTAEHFKRWDPARVLAECEALREVVGRYLQAERLVEANAEEHAKASAGGIDNQEQVAALRAHGWQLQGRRDGLELALRALAAPYADRPGFEEAWR